MYCDLVCAWYLVPPGRDSTVKYGRTGTVQYVNGLEPLFIVVLYPVYVPVHTVRSVIRSYVRYLSRTYCTVM